jgi:hypothetical protein
MFCKLICHVVTCGVVLQVWGLIASVLVQPDYVGWLVFAAGALTCVWLTLDRLYTPAYQFWSAFATACVWVVPCCAVLCCVERCAGVC